MGAQLAAAGSSWNLPCLLAAQCAESTSPNQQAHALHQSSLRCLAACVLIQAGRHATVCAANGNVQQQQVNDGDMSVVAAMAPCMGIGGGGG